MNKADLMTATERKDVTAGIGKTLSRAVKIVEVQNGKVPTSVLLGLGAAAEADLASRPSHHDAEGEHDHEDFETFIVDMPVFDTPQQLVDRIKKSPRCTTFCAPRASPRSRASRCASWCRAWAAASSISSTAPGSR